VICHTLLFDLIQLTMARIVNKQIVLVGQLPAQGAERRENLITVGVEKQSGLKAISLIDPKKPPVLLAEIIEGPLIRAYILQGEPLLLLKHNAPAYLPLETLEIFQSLDCRAVYGELQRLAECLGVDWMQVLFVLKDHQAWIYDIDTDPIYHGLPEAYQQRIGEGLARRFLGQEDAFESTTLAEQPQSRPTLFLRRMLRILFEFEYYKYRKSDEATGPQ
jgi:hypothetical protein